MQLRETLCKKGEGPKIDFIKYIYFSTFYFFNFKTIYVKVSEKYFQTDPT